MTKIYQNWQKLTKIDKNWPKWQKMTNFLITLFDLILHKSPTFTTLCLTKKVQKSDKKRQKTVFLQKWQKVKKLKILHVVKYTFSKNEKYQNLKNTKSPPSICLLFCKNGHFLQKNVFFDLQKTDFPEIVDFLTSKNTKKNETKMSIFEKNVVHDIRDFQKSQNRQNCQNRDFTFFDNFETPNFTFFGKIVRRTWGIFRPLKKSEQKVTHFFNTLTFFQGVDHQNVNILVILDILGSQKWPLFGPLFGPFFGVFQKSGKKL